MPTGIRYIQNISDKLMETGFVLSSTSLYNIILFLIVWISLLQKNIALIKMLYHKFPLGLKKDNI